MLTTLRGHVEADPLRIPAPAAMSTGAERSFADVLQETVAEPAATEPAAPPADAPAAEEPVTTATVDPDDAPPAEGEDPAATPDTAAQVVDQDAVAAAAAEADVTSSLQRGEPVRQETAGKGTDSPRSSTVTGEPLRMALVQQRATSAATVAMTGNTGANQPVTTRPTAEAPVRGVEGLAARPTAPLRAAQVAAGYRTHHAASAQLLDHARDSVFKQILMQLTPAGGELRMRLEPPELGELDLRLVVENGNQLSLSIAAERQDLVQLLQRHLDELKQTLRAAGLEITDAQVGHRDDSPAPDRQTPHGGQPRDEGAANQASPRVRSGGYVSAEGLDFWV